MAHTAAAARRGGGKWSVWQALLAAGGGRYCAGWHGCFVRRESAARAGMKAFVVNRIGDFGFLIALFLLIRTFGSLTFDEVFRAVGNLPAESAGAGVLTAIGLLLLAGACGKSAQLPLY